jgi:hypothetical protein
MVGMGCRALLRNVLCRMVKCPPDSHRTKISHAWRGYTAPNRRTYPRIC